MMDEDVWLLDGIRQNVNGEIRNRLTDGMVEAEVVNWWSLLGATEEVTLPELRRRDIMDKDNVHLSFGEHGKAAAALFHRILRPRLDARAGMVKRRKMRMTTNMQLGKFLELNLIFSRQ